MIISVIAAVAKNGTIGKGNDLPWHLPADMKFFKETTTGHHIIAGRKNYISIPEKYRPLPNRTNIVITRNPGLTLDGAIVKNSLEDAIEVAKTNGEVELFIIGGGLVYEQSMELADKLYITHVEADIDGDVFFPAIDDRWQLESESMKEKDERNVYDMRFCVYTKTA